MYTATAVGSAVGLAGVLVFNMLLSPYFRYHRYRYHIDDECIDIKEGYLWVKHHVVPIERLHKLQTEKGPIDQMFKVAKVKVTTAGGDVTIQFLGWQLWIWSKTYIYVLNHAIIIEKNTMKKEKETIGIKNISNVNLEQNLFERLLRTCKVKLDTNSLSTADSTDVQILLKK